MIFYKAKYWTIKDLRALDARLTRVVERTAEESAHVSELFDTVLRHSTEYAECLERRIDRLRLAGFLGLIILSALALLYTGYLHEITLTDPCTVVHDYRNTFDTLDAARSPDYSWGKWPGVGHELFRKPVAD